ncbi:MAG: hypothetical protein ACRDP6_08430 [Actinoallomurus sp.]
MPRTTDYAAAAAALGLATAPASAPGEMARCTERSCPVRWTSGVDRVCPDHRDSSSVTAYLEQLQHTDDYEAEMPGSVLDASSRRGHRPG